LLNAEDPSGKSIASVLAQAGVPASYAGASLVDANGQTVVEGVAGQGDAFMLGTDLPGRLPDAIIADVVDAITPLSERFGPVRTEWVHDGGQVWIVQLHKGATRSTASMLVPGERANWIKFDASDGLEALRKLFAHIHEDSGIEIQGVIGMTSHMADLARKSGIPTRVVPR
jgi:hypothetical protein